MNKKIIISILVIFVISLVIITIIIPAYLYRQSDTLLTISYVCTTGLKPTAFSIQRSYDNGTHTIDMDNCKWLQNNEYRNRLNVNDLNSMDCAELIEKNELGLNYLSKEARSYAKAKISNCEFIKDFSSEERSDTT